MINIAQIGCGYWGPNLLRNFTLHPDCRVKWVAEKSRERRAYIEANYSNTQTIEDWNEVLADEGVQGVVIATPASTHFDIAKASLEAGKHTFVEKPLAMSVQDADALCDLSKRVGKILMVGHTFLFNPAVRKIKEQIDGGELGDIYYIYSQRLNFRAGSS